MNDVVLESIQLDIARDIPSEITSLNNENLNLKNIKRGLTSLIVLGVVIGLIIYYNNEQERRNKQSSRK
jgi:hypothetical protein